MSLINYNRTLFPRWTNFIERIAPEDGMASFDSKFDLVPAANIEEKVDQFVISMAIPGINKEDIDIEVNDNLITISTENESTIEENEKNYTRKEYSYHSFSRSFKLPQKIKEEDIEASYKNGELKLQLPKAEVLEKTVKKIKVA